jgi:hypothetical protein
MVHGKRKGSHVWIMPRREKGRGPIERGLRETRRENTA